MNIHHIQRAVSVLFVSLLASIAVIGCQAGDTGESGAAEEIAETEQALPNCVGTCAMIYRLCVNSGDDPEFCAADRDACIQECDEQTCEPGEPDCCQGQPTCW